MNFRSRSQIAFLLAALSFFAVAASAGTLTGVVRNGTTGAAAAGQSVVLIKLQGGMEGIETVKTDAQGRFRFERPEIGQQPMLLRVVYRGVNYHQSVPPGRSEADIEIFEPGASEKDLQIASRMIIVQPNGATLLVGEEYTIQNKAQPPTAFSKEFEFRIPDGAELAQVSAWGSSGMPTVQGTTNKGANHYGVPFPLRPGQNGIRISYQLPYASNQATVGTPALYPVQRVMVIAPPTMQVQGSGFQPAGTEQGWSVYARDAVAAGTAVSVSVSGTAPPPAEESSAQQSSAQGGGNASGMTVRAMPGRLDEMKWVLIGGLGVIFAMGAFFLWRRPLQPAVVGGAQQAVAATRVPAQKVEQVREQIDREVGRGLDEIKDLLFRLELRRQAGTISEEEYARERGRAEKVLRDLVRG